MKSIKGGDTIPFGVYSGKRLRDVVKKYGRKVLLEIVKCNDVDDVYLKKYHYHHPATEEEKRNWELKKKQMEMIHVEICESTPEEEVFDSTATLSHGEENLSQDYVETHTWDSVLYDPEDDHGDECYLPLRVCEPGIYSRPLKGLQMEQFKTNVYE